MDDKNIISTIEDSLSYLKEFENGKQQGNFGHCWDRIANRENGRLIDQDLKIDEESLKNFRGKIIYVSDFPSARLKSFYHSSSAYYKFKDFLNNFIGTQRGGRKLALDGFEAVEKMGFLDLLKKYPSPHIGNPMNITHKGYTFTNRYIRHIYQLGLFNKYLKDKVPEDSVVMDIGSTYGISSSLIKQELPKSHHVLVDLTGQLVMAQYYLSKMFPQAKIAGFREIGTAGYIDKEFIKQYDFVLVPTSMYDFLMPESVDVITNFISLSEMSREWFEKYINSEVFKTTTYFYTINRYDAYPTYTTNITVLDYPLSDFERIYMRTCPFLHYYYKRFMLFGCRRATYPSQFFQFIGKRRGK